MTLLKWIQSFATSKKVLQDRYAEVNRLFNRLDHICEILIQRGQKQSEVLDQLDRAAKGYLNNEISSEAKLLAALKAVADFRLEQERVATEYFQNQK